MLPQNMFRKVAWLLYLAWCLGLTLLVYGAAITLPFFFDDFVHLPFVDEHSFTEIWQTAGRLTYFRPMPFATWKLMYALIGYHSPGVQHALNLLLHAVSAILVGWLAGQLWPRDSAQAPPISPWARRFLSATLFVLFPFSYQAVPWVGSLAHLLVTFLVLLSLATYWQMRRTERKIWGAFSLFVAFLAPFAHENGALIGPLLAAILFTRLDYRQQTLHYLRHAITWTLPALIWLPIWWTESESTSGSVAVGGIEPLLQNLAYFAQGAAYPLSWLGNGLRDMMAMPDMMASVLLTALALIGAALIQWLNNADRRSLLPWLWCGIASLPAILFLSFDYVINGPRLLMLASVGIAWLWTDVFLLIAGWTKTTRWISDNKRWLRTAAAVGILSVTLAHSYNFVQRRVKFHEILGSTYNRAVAIISEVNAAGDTAIIINLPAWIAPSMPDYALGHEGVQFWPSYAPAAALASVNSGQSSTLILARSDAIRPEMPYFYGLSGSTPDWAELAAAGGSVFLAQYDSDGVTFKTAGKLSPLPSADRPVAFFEDPESQAQVSLIDASANSLNNGVEVNLIWKVERPPPDHVTVFVHAVDENGHLGVQADGDLLAGSLPLNHSPAGEIVEDRRFINSEEPRLTLLVGLYDRLTGQRLVALSMTGERWPDDAVTLAVE